MDFARPWVLYFLFVLPLAALALVLVSKKRKGELLIFTGEVLAKSLAPGWSWRRNFLKSSMLLSSFAMILIALAGPRFGRQLVKVQREGIDLVIALDTSLSMLAEDMKPNRLERAKMEVIDLINGLQGDRVAIVVFSGEAFPLCPLTVDYDAALMFASSVDVNVVSEPGTAIGKAIERSLAIFEDSRRKDRVIILITDGESHEGDAVKQAEKAGDRGVRIYSIGLGNPSGELIPLRGTDGVVEGYKKDKNGKTVMTRLDEATLQAIARASGGKYLPATRESLELKVIYNEIAGMEKKMMKGEFVERKKERFFWFLAASFLLLALEMLIPTRGSGKQAPGRRLLHTGIAMMLLVLFGAPPYTALGKSVNRGKTDAGNKYFDAGQYDKALALYKQALGDTVKLPDHYQGIFYNQANTYYKTGKYKEALEHYQRSFDAGDSLLTGSMLYNRGNTLLKADNIEDAITSYTQAIKFIPDDPDVLHNLELALQRLNEDKNKKKKQESKNEKDREGEGQESKQQNGDKQNKQKEEKSQQNKEKEEQKDQKEESSNSDSTKTLNPSRPDTSKSERKRGQEKPMKLLSKEDALRILRALEEQENNLQKEKKKAAFKKIRKRGKDW